MARTSSPSRWSRASARPSDPPSLRRRAVAVTAPPPTGSGRARAGPDGHQRRSVEPASAAHERRNAPSDRASTASSGMRWRTSAVNTPIGVSAGSAVRSRAAQDVTHGSMPIDTTRPRPSLGSRSMGTVGPLLISMRANRCSVWAATSGPRRSAPSVVTKRVVSPARSALWTTLAATVTARSNASAACGPSGTRWSSSTTQRCRPSTLCWRTFSVSERADARQWMVRGSSPSTYSRRLWKSPGPSRWANASRWRPSTPWPSNGMSSEWARGETSTSSTPATSDIERARPRTSWRTATRGPIVSTPRRSVGIR